MRVVLMQNKSLLVIEVASVEVVEYDNDEFDVNVPGHYVEVHESWTVFGAQRFVAVAGQDDVINLLPLHLAMPQRLRSRVANAPEGDHADK